MTEQKRIIALGFFDGVHLGHAALMDMTKKRAAELNAVPTVLTFDVHPDTLVRGTQVPLINDAAGRADLIRRVCGIDSVVFIHFDGKMMHMPWQQFAATLADELSAAHFVVGHDFRFGWKGEGNGEKLGAYCAEHAMGCDVIPAVRMDGEIISSTRIRELISAGEISRANALLGHRHCLVDTVRYGYRLGTKLGAPTINMRFPEGVLVPRFGVYAAKVFLDTGAEYSAVTNIGVRPTFNGESVSVESYILDFSGNLYDHSVRVEFCEFIRPEIKFSSPDELKKRIEYDAQLTRDYFSGK